MNVAVISYFWRNQGASILPSVKTWNDLAVANGGTTLNQAELMAISGFLTELESYGLGIEGSKLKTMNLFNFGGIQHCLLNLKDVANFKLQQENTVLLSSKGAKSSGISYFRQPFLSDQYTGLYTDLTMVNYVSESSTAFGTQSPSGFKTNSEGTYRTFRSLNTSTTGRRNTNSGNMNFPSTNHKGLYIHTYDGTNSVMYKDGTKTSNATTPTASNISINRHILALNDANAGNVPSGFFTPSSVSLDALYDRFTDTNAANFKTAYDKLILATGL